ncbi:hypothetical protein ABTY61_28745 [Kitasatospora sp. NPDC096128]|uniref:hypothetical protein n=1 Tax=Kitasatospora sp. NPDC096128 TaxID=3155547 RepID=UPI0033219FAE
MRSATITGLGLDFPHAVQAVSILRHRTDLKAGTVSRQTVYAISDLISQEASPQRLGRLARSQWTIENRLHFVRDTAFGEDASKIRTGHEPEDMTTLRNLAITATSRPVSATSPTSPSPGRWTSWASPGQPLYLITGTLKHPEEQGSGKQCLPHNLLRQQQGSGQRDHRLFPDPGVGRRSTLGACPWTMPRPGAGRGGERSADGGETGASLLAGGDASHRPR